MKKTLAEVISEHRYVPLPPPERPRSVECLCGWSGGVDVVAGHIAVQVRLWVLSLVADPDVVASCRTASDEVRPFTSKWQHSADAVVAEFVLNSMGLRR